MIAKRNEEKYLQNPKLCLHCAAVISYEAANNKFCDHSCSASHTNKIRTIKRKNKLPKEIIQQERFKKARKVYKYTCPMCTTKHESFNKPSKNGNMKACSSRCIGKLISCKVKGKTGGSTKQYIQITDSFGSLVSLDSSWELTLAEDLNAHSVNWSRPKSFLLSNGHRYTPDFYLPDFDLYLDPKAYRKGYLKQLEKIRLFEREFSARCIVISERKNLNWSFVRESNSVLCAGNAGHNQYTNEAKE